MVIKNILNLTMIEYLDKQMDNKLFETYLKKIIQEELTNKNKNSWIMNTVRGAQQLGGIPNSNLKVLRDVLNALIEKLAAHPYGDAQKKSMIKAINIIFVGDKETAKAPQWEDAEQVRKYIDETFPNKNPVGSEITDYGLNHYKVWKYNKPACYMVCEDISDHKVYWVDTEELLKGFTIK